MSPHDMHGKRFPRWTDCVTVAALNPTTIDVFCLDVMLHMISPKRGESTRQTLPSTTFQFLHARLDHLIQVCTDEMSAHSTNQILKFSLFNFNFISNASL